MITVSLLEDVGLICLPLFSPHTSPGSSSSVASFSPASPVPQKVSRAIVRRRDYRFHLVGAAFLAQGFVLADSVESGGCVPGELLYIVAKFISRSHCFSNISVFPMCIVKFVKLPSAIGRKWVVL